MTSRREARLGAWALDDGRCAFRVWAPAVRGVAVRILDPTPRRVRLDPEGDGHHAGVVADAPPGTRYAYELDGDGPRPDPASRSQPEGVHGPSAVADPSFPWSDGEWRGLPLEDYVLYELHVGTFSPEGTFDGVRRALDDLRDLGVTAVELMPVSEFPGDRNWGYDGVFPFAAHHAYGGIDGLRRLVDACHGRGLAVVLDVVYNHLGPEGNRLGDFGPYFTDAYRTPWGPAINFDGADSDGVRRFFRENALHWVEDAHVDALRLDAVHAIVDRSPRPFLRELGDAVHGFGEASGRRVHLIAEDDRNDPRLVRRAEEGGLGLDAQWNDDFHHAIHAYLTGERGGYYEDFGDFAHVRAAMSNGYVYTGQYSRYRRRRHGAPCGDLPPRAFLVFAQNHDQVGNRAGAERLATLLPFEALKLVAASVILSPFLPLLFMGEEYGETAPFQYFVSHSDPDLIAAVRSGRREEFRAFGWDREPPDPQDAATFRRSKLNRALGDGGHHAALRGFYREAIRLRREHPALRSASREDLEVRALDGAVLVVRRTSVAGDAVVIANFSSAERRAETPIPEGPWTLRLDSSDARWKGPGGRRGAGLRSSGTAEIPLTGFQCVVFDGAMVP